MPRRPARSSQRRASTPNRSPARNRQRERTGGSSPWRSAPAAKVPPDYSVAGRHSGVASDTCGCRTRTFGSGTAAFRFRSASFGSGTQTLGSRTAMFGFGNPNIRVPEPQIWGWGTTTVSFRTAKFGFRTPRFGFRNRNTRVRNRTSPVRKPNTGSPTNMARMFQPRIGGVSMGSRPNLAGIPP
jgi:hypothetical protein